MLLYEKYRPKRWSEIIGQDAALRRIETIKRIEGLAGQCVWLIGKSGSGKTSIARLLAREVCDPAYIVEVNACDVDEKTLAGWVYGAQSKPVSGRIWAYILNETHRMHAPIVSKLLTVLEDAGWQRNCLLIGTTTLAGDKKLDKAFDAAPLGSRTKKIRLSCNVCEAFAHRAAEIADLEGLNGKPPEDYVKLAKKYQNNLREMINRIAQGEMLATG